MWSRHCRASSWRRSCALYHSAKIVALKITTDRIAIERAARGLNDPNTIKGAQAAPAAPAGEVSSADALQAAVDSLPKFPDM
jgi:cytochrome c5